jgi:hypothetical protein
MADDITLTVRVRDLARGDLARVRQQLRGMDDDVRRVGQSSDGMSDRARVLSREINGVSGRLGQLSRTGSIARTEMTHMNRTMSLLGRDLNLAQRAGHLTREEFNALRNQLDETRLGFDRLNRDLQRSAAVALQRQRAQAAADRDDMRRRVANAQQTYAQIQRMTRSHTAALREEARRQREEVRRQAAADQAEMRRRIADARSTAAQMTRIARAHTAALREEARRQAEATRAATAARTQALRDEERQRNLLRSAVADPNLTRQFRANGMGDNNSLSRGFGNLQRALQGISGSSDNARRHIGLFSRDVNAMSSVLRRAQADGHISRRDYDTLSSGLAMASRQLRDMGRAGVLPRSTLRSMRNELRGLRTDLADIDRAGNIFRRLYTHLGVVQRRLRAVDSTSGRLRRTFARIGDGLISGLRPALPMLAGLLTGFRGIGSAIVANKRWLLIFIAVLALIGPIAQALGAVLTVALGGAFIALGAFALKGNAEVKSAFSQMKDSMKGVITTAALPLKDALVSAMDKAGAAINRFQPVLKQAFTAAAPLVNDFVGAFGKFAEQALPGMITALEHSKGAMSGFKDGMARIGQGFGNMFKIITSGNGDDLARAWGTLGEEIGSTLEAIGRFTSNMLKSGTASLLVIGIFRTFNGILNVIAGAFKMLDTVSLGFFRQLADNISKFGEFDKSMSDSFGTSGKSLGELKKELKQVNDELDKKKKKAEDDGVVGPAKKYAMRGDDGTDLLEKRKALLAAIAKAEADNADAVTNEAMAYKDLIGAIESLAELNRNYLDAQVAQAQAIDDAKKKIKEGKKNHEDYAHALRMVDGQLDKSTQVGRDAYGMLSQIAQATKESTDKAIAAKAPWDQISKNWRDGYNQIVKLGDGMGLSAAQAQALATQILGMPPSKTIEFKARTEEAIAGFSAVIAAANAAPNAKTVYVKALTSDAVGALQALGFTVTQLPDGRFSITADTGTAKSNIGKVQAARDALKGKNVTMSATDASTRVINAIQSLVNSLHGKNIVITTTHKNILQNMVEGPALSAADAIRQQAKNARGGSTGGMAGFLPKSHFATGGSVSGSVLQGPGTTTSDSLVARLSRGEFVMRAAAVRKYGPDFMRALNYGSLALPGYASGGHVSSSRSKAAAAAVKGARSDLIKQMTISAYGHTVGAKSNSFENSLAKPVDLKALFSSIAAAVGLIKKAFSGKTESKLVARMNSAGKALIKYEQKLTKVNASLEKAKAKLDDLKQAAASVNQSVKTGIVSSANITKVATGDDTNTTMPDIMKMMSENATKSRRFSDMLSALKQKGVSGQIIGQIAEAGMDGGGFQTAKALTTASTAQITSINAMQQQIDNAAKAAGQTASDAMYGAGIRAAQGLVNGITKQKKSIESAMMSIAKSMEKAIKHALGIKSPSRVMQKLGHYTAEGFAVGIENNRSVRSAWSSMLDVDHSSPGASAGAPSGGGGVYTFPIYIGGKFFDEIVLDSNRRTVRTRGGNVQNVFGRR